MPRTIPLPPPRLKTPELTTWTLKLKTITPMFGGSATPREVDTKNPIRAASVRGHLRFWWRATAGARYNTAKELFKAEEEIWGSDKKYGKVALHVAKTKQERLEPCCSYYHPTRNGQELKTYPYFGEYPGYALFPFQGKAKREKAKRDRQSREITVTEEPTKALLNCEFSVCIHISKAVEQEVWNAIAAWVDFGGIGSRTRRGCGSLEVLEIKPENKELKPVAPMALEAPWLTALQATYLLKKDEDKPFTDPIEAWKTAVDCYRDFRQALGHARFPSNDPKKPAGRSKYPEPDSIRRLFSRLNWKHQVEHSVNGFPRADLGLPIGFHFTEEGPEESFVLEPKRMGHKRFASPVITKAIKVTGGYVAAILLLQSPHIWDVDDLVLSLPEDGKRSRRGQQIDIPRSQVKLTSPDLQNIPPLKGLPIREALLEFAKSKGFKEVCL